MPLFRSGLFFSSLGAGFIGRAAYGQQSSSSSSNFFDSASCFFTTSSDRHAAASTSSVDDSSCPVPFDALRSGAVWGQKWDPNWDNLKSGASSNVRTQYILIRHGQYMNESSGRPDNERVLTSLGIEQARACGRCIRDTILNNQSELFYSDKIDAIYSSDLTRAIQTCEYMCDEIQKNNDDPDGARQADIKNRWVVDGALAERFPCDCEPPYPKRADPRTHEVVEGAFKKHIRRPKAGVDQNQTVVLVCHANVIRYFVCRALQLPPEAWLRISLPHTSLTTLSVRGSGNVSLGMVGAATHLPTHMQTVHNKAGRV